MAKKQNNPQQQLQDADLKHYRDTERYVKQVQQLYDEAIDELSELALRINDIPTSKAFSFKHNPAVAKDVESTIQKLAEKISAVVETGSRKEWSAACIKSDQFLSSIMQVSKIAKATLQSYQDRNLAALAAFTQREVDGMNLSGRVWKMVSPLQDEVEAVVDTTPQYQSHGINSAKAAMTMEQAVGTGMSAQRLSREVRECLQEPNKLFRRVRDKYGNLHLSAAAKLYHPGQGVYRSSYKNAMRLTRSEINMAYRQSDHMRWQQLDFVTGIRIQLSNNHTCLGADGRPHAFTDICDILAGDYPKDFKHVGWHPQCRCFATPILRPYDEMMEEREHIDEAGYRKMPASNEVKDPPKAFNEYITDNAERIAGWKSTPYYIKDNAHYVDKALHPEKYITKALALTDDQQKMLDDFRMYAFNHQDSKKFAAALDDALRAQLAGDLPAFQAAVKTMADTRKTNERIAAYLAKKKAEGKKTPKERRKEFDSRIASIKEKAQLYPNKKTITTKAIEEAYQAADIAKLEKAIAEQEEIIRRHEVIIDMQKARRLRRTEQDRERIVKFAEQHKKDSEAAYKTMTDIMANASSIQEADISTLMKMMTLQTGTTTTAAGKKVSASIERMMKEASELRKIQIEYDQLKTKANYLASTWLGKVKDIDVTTAVSTNSIKVMKEEIKKIEEARIKITSLTNIEDPMDVAMTYGMKAAIDTDAAVAKKIAYFEGLTPPPSFSGTKLEYQAKKLTFEAVDYLGGNMNDVQAKYPAWKVAQKAYLKKLDEVKVGIMNEKTQAGIAELQAYLATHKAPSIKALVENAIEDMANGKYVAAHNHIHYALQKKATNEARKAAKGTAPAAVKAGKQSSTYVTTGTIDEILPGWNTASSYPSLTGSEIKQIFANTMKDVQGMRSALPNDQDFASWLKTELSTVTPKSLDWSYAYSTAGTAIRDYYADHPEDLLKRDIYLKVLMSKASQLQGKVKGGSQGYKFESSKFTPAAKKKGKLRTSDQDADDALAPLTEEWWAKADAEQQLLAYEYTHGSGYFNNPTYSSYTTERYDIFGRKMDKAWNNIDRLTELIDAAPGLKAPMTVVRGEDSGGFRGKFGIDITSVSDPKSLIGKTGTNAPFTSTAVVGGSGFPGEIEYEIFLPQGAKGIYVEPCSHYQDERSGRAGYAWNGIDKRTSYGGEQEFVLQRGSVFKIVDVQKQGSTYKIKLELIEQPAKYPGQR